MKKHLRKAAAVLSIAALSVVAMAQSAFAAQDYSDLGDGVTGEITAVLPVVLAALVLIVAVPRAIRFFKGTVR